MDVKGLKLISGEEIIGEVRIEENSDYVVIKNPLSFQVSQQGMGFGPWLNFASKVQNEKGLKIDMCDILTIYDLADNLINEYKQRFGGVVVAPSSTLELLK